MRGDDGQATIELVLFLPFLLLLALAGAALLAAQAADEQAGMAAEAGALALFAGSDARAAARDALSPGTRATIEVHGRRVTVNVRPYVAVDAVARLLTATETADTGAAP
jgi:hypothetical protein